ncbi:MAG TPA: YceH family protein [Solirubrobacteraceae bacterium]|nr:YceH family protein [Solirubrobacteraceae bacterium]
MSTGGLALAGGAGLSAPELRVLGCLLEKQRTTPDAYPLSLNALRLACNQSTNRDPVVSYDDATLRDALHRLERRGLVRLASGAGSRAAKYRHLLAEALPMDAAEQAVMCALMLRGAQTPGELKQRGERMHRFADLGEVHGTLERLIERELAVRLARRPGHKEERYAQLLAQDADAQDAGRESPDATPALALDAGANGAFAAESRSREASPGDEDAAVRALRELSERVARLERELAELRAAVDPAEGVRTP